ncbi:MAG TPA: tRNA guanosine(34) transglycosylase Tgt [Candidatus Nanopelagicales bacterium]
MPAPFSFQVEVRRGLARTGTITTPHGSIRTPAFIPVGTKATVKALLPESVAGLGAQAVLANAYHLYLQPGADLVDAAGGLGAFMAWPGPTFTDSGGFQVMSLGVGFKKVLAMQSTGVAADDVIAPGKQRLAHVDDDGVGFVSHLDGSRHRFTPESSMAVQHQLGADIMFAFDECTTLLNTRDYQERSVARTAAWARRCLAAHAELTGARPHRPYQALFAVVQGAQYEDLRRAAARDLGGLAFDGYGIGGALEKSQLEEIVGWVSQELPEDRPRHLLGIGEPDDLFAGVAAGADTFDCVMPSRVARNGAILSRDGRYNIATAANRRSFDQLDEDCDCATCAHHTRAYLHHLSKSDEIVGHTLATIHNVRFLVRLVDQMREALERDELPAFREEFLGRYDAKRRVRPRAEGQVATGAAAVTGTP